MNFKTGIRLASITMAAVIGTVSLTACSIPGFKSSPTPSPASAQTTAEQATKTPEEEIVGEWKIESILDKSGNTVSLSDVDLTGTPLEEMSGVIGMVLKTGVTLNFKADKTVSFSVLSGNYEINDNKLTLSVPQVSKSIELSYSIDNNNMKVKIDSYSINLKRQ